AAVAARIAATIAAAAEAAAAAAVTAVAPVAAPAPVTAIAPVAAVTAVAAEAPRRRFRSPRGQCPSQQNTLHAPNLPSDRRNRVAVKLVNLGEKMDFSLGLGLPELHVRINQTHATVKTI